MPIRRPVSIAVALLALVAAGAWLSSRGGMTVAEDKVASESTKVAKDADSKSKTEKPNSNDGETGTARFIVAYMGMPPKLPNLVAAAGPGAGICAAALIPDESLVVDAKTGRIANVVIWLPKPPDAYSDKTELKDTVLDQKGCRFIPHVALVRVGQTVQSINGDPLAHNVHTSPIRNSELNFALGANDNVGAKYKYTKPERLPVGIKCDLHSWMRAYQVVMDHPFAAVTKANGECEIPDLPAGKYEFTVWQERAGYLDRKVLVVIEAGKTTEVNLSYPAEKLKG